MNLKELFHKLVNEGYYVTNIYDSERIQIGFEKMKDIFSNSDLFTTEINDTEIKLYNKCDKFDLTLTIYKSDFGELYRENDKHELLIVGDYGVVLFRIIQENGNTKIVVQ